VCETVYQEFGYEQSVGNLAQVSLDGDNVFGVDTTTSAGGPGAPTG
jgi:hypothetical protein